MTTIKANYTGELHTEATHIASGAIIYTDAPIDNYGKGNTFSPTDLLASSLGSCMTTLMGITANTHGFKFKEAAYEVTKIMAANPRRVAEIRVVISMQNGDYSEKQRRLLEAAAINCPVAKSLHPDLIQHVDFIY